MVLNVTNLLDELNELGVQIGAEGGRLLCWPQAAVTSELGDRLREHKEALLEILNLPFDDPSAFWIRTNEQNWLDARDEDVESLTRPRPPLQQCPWCCLWTKHTQACIDLRRSWIPVFPIGKKHKGVKIDQVPRNYLQWAWDAGALRDADVKECVREILGIKEAPRES